MSIGDRIRKRRKELKLSVDYIAEKLGKNRATIYRYEGDEIEDMSINVIEDIAKILKIDPGYLMGWKKSQEDISTTGFYNYYDVSVSAGVPIVAEAVAEYEVKKIEIPHSVMGKWAGNTDIFIMRINGESMNRTMPHGSLIAVKPIELHKLKDGDIVVFSDNHEYSVKRFYQYDDMIVFRPDSDDVRFAETRISKKEADGLQIHGKVVLYIVELD